MKMWRGIHAMALIWALVSPFSLAAQPKLGPSLIDVTVAPAAYTPADQKVVRLQETSDPSIQWVVPVKINPDALSYDEFTMFLRDQHVRVRKDPQPLEQTLSIWSGDVILPGDHPDELIGGARDVRVFIAANGRFYASIRIDHEVYTVSTLPSGRYILTKQDVSRLPDEGDDAVPNPDLKASPTPTGGEPPVQTMDTIRVAIGFSIPSTQGDLAGLIAAANSAVESANASFAASNIMLRVEVAAFAHESFYSETTVEQARQDLLNSTPSSGPLWLTHVARQSELADVAVMLVLTTQADNCGAANLGSTSSTAFMAVRRACLTSQTFAHELGHLLSAHHNPENVGNVPALFPYGHGYRWNQLAKGNATIMASTSGGAYARRNIWSDPHGEFLNQPTGTVETHDNALVIRQTKSTVAGFYPEPQEGVAATGGRRIPLYTPTGIMAID